MKLPPWLWRIFHSRWLKRALICSPFVLSLGIVAFYFIVNWWAVRKFERTVGELKAAGYSMTPEEVGAPGADLEEEVFFHPLLAAELSRPGRSDFTSLTAMSLPGVSSRSQAWEFIPGIHRFTDVRLWTNPPRPADPEAEVAKSILAMIQPQADRFDALSPAFDRPGGGWYFGRPEETLPRLLGLIRFRAFLQDRALLYLAAGEVDKAAADVETMFKIDALYRKKPTSSAVGLSRTILSSTVRLVEEGVRRGAWTDEQLKKFQMLGEKIDAQDTTVRGVIAETPFFIVGIRRVIDAPDHAHEGFAWDDIRTEIWSGLKNRDSAVVKKNLALSWLNVRPWGFDVIEQTDWLRQARAEGFHPGAGRRQRITAVDQTRYQTMEGKRPEWARFNVYTTFSFLGRSALDTETRLALMRCGIATERYRLKHGALPPDLKALVPEFLPAIPADVCDGAPLRYRLLPDGSPLIWSLWPEGKDLGGMPRRTSTEGNRIWTTGEIPGLTEASYKR